MIHYTEQEDRLNTWSHALGIVLGVAMGAVFLSWCVRAHNGWAFFAVSLYVFGMLSSYVASTAYHGSPPSSPLRARLRHWDHAAIYWHIAGSYSPVTLLAMQDVGWWGWGLFLFVWLAALVGTCMSFLRLKEHSHLETVCFVLMGLSVLVAFKPLSECVAPATLWWLVAEGVCYVLGAVVYALSHGRLYVHAVFHVFVLAGSVCHIVCVGQVLSLTTNYPN